MMDHFCDHGIRIDRHCPHCDALNSDNLVDSIMACADWTPFEKATPVSATSPIVVAARALDTTPYQIYKNNKYQVAVYQREASEPGWPAMIHLSIKRLDKQTVHDWRDLQRIKNELVGPEHEAVELYPAESRLVDSANQYHLFCLADPGVRFPFGFNERFVSNTSEHGAVQRPFPSSALPPDCMTTAEYLEKKNLTIKNHDQVPKI
jgi:hypothetical protein